MSLKRYRLRAKRIKRRPWQLVGDMRFYISKNRRMRRLKKGGYYSLLVSDKNITRLVYVAPQGDPQMTTVQLGYKFKEVPIVSDGWIGDMREKVKATE